MIFSKSTEYAIQAMIYLAVHPTQDKIMVSTIAEDYDIPRHFLARLVQTLAKHHLIKSTRGRGGGVQLNRPAEDIRVSQIVEAIEGPPPESDMCVIGLDECNDQIPCPLHDQWQIIKENINRLMVDENLAHLAKEVIRKRELLRKMK